MRDPREGSGEGLAINLIDKHNYPFEPPSPTTTTTTSVEKIMNPLTNQ